MEKRVLVLGSNGKIGSHSCKHFERAGWNVARYERGTCMSEAANGAQLIINGLNPPNYHNWSKLIPQITEMVIAAAKTNGASVLIPGNVYNLDDEGGLWDENTPHRPVSKKGRIREEMELRYRSSGVKTIILRAGNFIAPYASDDVMKMLHFRGINSDRITALASPDIAQSYCYAPDWARAAVELAHKQDELEQFEDIPFPGYTFSVNELKAIASEILERELTIARFPWALFRLSAPFWELAREMNEMRYL